MTWKRLGILAVCLLIVALLGAGSVYWASLQEPDFYEQAMAAEQPPEVRKKQAKQFEEQTLQLAENIKNADEWSEEFEQDQINSWLAEELHHKFEREVPDGVSDPRILLTDGKVHVGFRYDDTSWKGIVSMVLRPWITEKNQLALEVESVRAGLLPIPVEEVLGKVSDRLTTNGWRVEWTESDGHDVLVVHLDNGKADQPVLESVEVDEGKLRVSGRRDTHQSPATTFQFPRTADKFERNDG